MYFYQYLYIGLFFILLNFKASRFAALIFLFSFSIYISFILNIESNEWYYKLSAFKELIVGFILIKRYFWVAFLSVLLIAVNSYGFMIYEYGYDPYSYDIMCFIIITLQIMLLTTRGLLNGVNRSVLPFWLVRLVNFDGFQSRVTMHKNTPNKEAKK